MDKLNFQKAIDTLRNTECTSKVQQFEQIFTSLKNLTNHSNYKVFLQNALQTLLLFCEDNDSNVRINAEENLNRIIRLCEYQHQMIFILIELYHEIKKNGNERSLRICLNLFSHYAHLVKHRRKKVYAQNLVPCMLAIGKRHEPLVIETFTEFIKSFSKYLLNCLSEYEVMKLIELFMSNLLVECQIKRRCSAQNVITILENYSKKSAVIKSVVARIQENLSKSQDMNAIIGSLGLLRLLIPLMITTNEYTGKVVELLETCLNYLKTESNHSKINASLEVVNALLTSAAANHNFKDILIDNEQKLSHKEILLSRHSTLLNTPLNESRKSSSETIKQQDNFLNIPSTSLLSTPNKSLGDFSDVEGDSFKSADFDMEVSSSPAALRNVIGAAETMSMKSTDSINSFFNSILTHSNATDTVAKFFRKSSATESPAHASKMSDLDDKSLDISISNLKDDAVDCPDSQALPETAEMALEDILDETLEVVDTTPAPIEPNRELYIGTLYDQSIVDYIVRLVSSKFLLEGEPKMLVSDQIVRVSIKNLALSVIAACVELKSEVLLMKLSKDFTDESMLVETLLSYLVDEDLRLEEEEMKKKSEPETSTAAEKSENFLEIKDDHFGECTTATFLDYFSPLSEAIDDQGLISLKNRIYEEKSKDREESAKKINHDLCQLLSRSEIIESKKPALPLMETTLKMPEDKDCQFIADVLLYASHGDPALRENVKRIIGIFVKNILEKNFNYDMFIEKREFIRDSLKFKAAINMLLTGIKDEIHSVVKQTLVMWENCINLVISVMEKEEVENLLDQLLMVFYNKYWLVQCKYCDVITKINFRLVAGIIGHNHADVYQKYITQQLLVLVKDNDFRVRNYASKSITSWIRNLSLSVDMNETSPLSNFVRKQLLNYEAFKVVSDDEYNISIVENFSPILYELSNLLMDLKDKNLQFGIIHALKILLRDFDSLSYHQVWKEFNILTILLSFVNKNPGIALHISCQCDMMDIIVILIAAEGINNSLTSINIKDYLSHLLKILNIYGHLMTNSKPLVVPKGKSDLFTSSKELAIINSIGFFSNEHFYLKLYLVLKNSHDSYRMTINQDADVKFKQLLCSALKSLQILLELRLIEKDDTKLIEEIAKYLNLLIPFQPDTCIVTTKVLLKFLFQKNFINRKDEIKLLKSAVEKGDAATVFSKFETFSVYNPDSTSHMQNFDNLIKLFDPLVIQGLRLFSKSPALLQTEILDMLCQLLEFNINYMQLDSKKVFVDFVLRQVDYIEDGYVRNGNALAPKITEFLIHLTKLKDKKLLTMPKIINIIDNLLASTNMCVKESGIQSLIVLSIELFFHKSDPLSTDAEVIEAHNKDINAQREVAVSMLLKFIHHRDVQECIQWIILKSKCESLETIVDENEIYQGLLQNLSENPICDFILIKSISKNILLESKNFKQFLSFYWKLLQKRESSLSMITFLQENILMKTEEVYLINHIKLYHQKQNAEGDALKDFVKLHHTYFKTLIEDNNCDLMLLKQFTNFIEFHDFPSIFMEFKDILESQLLIETSNATNIKNTIEYLLSMNMKFQEIEKIINSSHENLNKSMLICILYERLFDQRKDINAWESDELVNFFKDQMKTEMLLKFCDENVIACILEDEKIARVILRKMSSKIKVSLNMMLFIIEKSPLACLNDLLILIIGLSSRDDANILQIAFIKKLSIIKHQMTTSCDVIKITIDDLEKIKSKLFEFKVQKKFLALFEIIDDFIEFLQPDSELEVDFNDINKTVDEAWLFEEAKHATTNLRMNYVQVAEMMYEIKSESKLTALLNLEGDFSKDSIATGKSSVLSLLSSTLNISFENMLKNFRIDCIQINPHLNYMKMSPLLKVSIQQLRKHLENVDEENVLQLAGLVEKYMHLVRRLNHIGLIYVEAKYVEKYISDNLLKANMLDLLTKFLNFMIQQLNTSKEPRVLLQSIHSILMEESMNFSNIDDQLVTWIYQHLTKTLKNTEFVVKYQHPPLFDELNSLEVEEIRNRIDIVKKVIFIARIQEADADEEFKLVPISPIKQHLMEISFEITKYLLRVGKYYQFTITPYEVILNYRSGDDLLDKTKLRLKQIPIEYLNDSDLLERYIRRINRYGFTQRQEFEEIFMTLLVLLNQWNEMQEAEEQFCIKQLCLQMNVELILACFRHRSTANYEYCNYVHLPRSENWTKFDVTGMKKLHNIQEQLSSRLNVFYQPNLEKIDVGAGSDSISTLKFEMNQFSLDYTWSMINDAPSSFSHHMKNVTYMHAEKLGIDYKSALQLVYDLMTQMIDEDPILVLPQLCKLADFLDNNEQYKWIKQKMLALYETISTEDTISHQYIVYMLCRSYAVLVPSFSEVQQLNVMINKYLVSNHLFLRNATLQGLLCLFESLHKNNTTIGGISDELKLLRNTIINYTSKNGIVFECAVTTTSPQHNKLVWGINFYVIEKTLKFGDCNEQLIDTIISANNTLKRTNDFDLYFLIVNGLERLVIIDTENRLFREKVEKLALDLMKIENQILSIGGLKLLVTCMYTGSLEQLENTEKSNGIVQDEPEIVMQSTEKIDVLFNRIRTAAPDEAEICGRILSQILKDLLPPNEILTRIIKELLIMNQANILVIAKIIHQVFRTAIDSSYLAILQEWLICSLSNFLSYPNSKKSIWFLTLIFMSSTLNQHLLKLFPLILDEKMSDVQLHRLFIVSTKDFYERLPDKQKAAFRSVFGSKLMSSSVSPTTSLVPKENLFQSLLKHL